MKQVSCSHLEEISMKVVDACSSLRHGKSRLEEAEIPDASGAAISGYLIVVNLQDLFQTEEEWRQQANLRGALVHDGAVCSQLLALYGTTSVASRREPVQPPGICRLWAKRGGYPR